MSVREVHKLVRKRLRHRQEFETNLGFVVCRNRVPPRCRGMARWPGDDDEGTFIGQGEQAGGVGLGNVMAIGNGNALGRLARAVDDNSVHGRSFTYCDLGCSGFGSSWQVRLSKIGRSYIRCSISTSSVMAKCAELVLLRSARVTKRASSTAKCTIRLDIDSTR